MLCYQLSDRLGAPVSAFQELTLEDLSGYLAYIGSAHDLRQHEREDNLRRRRNEVDLLCQMVGTICNAVLMAAGAESRPPIDEWIRIVDAEQAPLAAGKTATDLLARELARHRAAAEIRAAAQRRPRRK